MKSRIRDIPGLNGSTNMGSRELDTGDKEEERESLRRHSRPRRMSSPVRSSMLDLRFDDPVALGTDDFGRGGPRRLLDSLLARLSLLLLLPRLPFSALVAWVSTNRDF